MSRSLYLVCALLALFMAGTVKAQYVRKKIPDKLVVLTFDDAVLSHATYVAPLLKKYGFGATFFVCEFLQPPFSDKTKYMSWEQIGALSKMGFEVANHTWHHTHVNKITPEGLSSEMAYTEQQCRDAGIKDKLISFAYPGYDTHKQAMSVLKDRGYLLARGGGNRPYEPNIDHPYLIPSYTTYATNRDQIMGALKEAKDGKIIVLTIHGVPDEAHPQVNTPPELFEEYLRYLRDNRYTVIAMRDLASYIDVNAAAAGITPDYSRVKNN